MIHLTAVEIDVTLLNVRRLFEFLLRKQVILRYKELFFLECDFFSVVNAPLDYKKIDISTGRKHRNP